MKPLKSSLKTLINKIHHGGKAAKFASRRTAALSDSAEAAKPQAPLVKGGKNSVGVQGGFTCNEASLNDKSSRSLRRVFSLRTGRRAVSLLLTVTTGASMFALLSNVTFPQSADAKTVESQTAYSNISDFQKNEFTRIQSKIFGTSLVSYDSSSTSNSLKTAKTIVSNRDKYRQAVTDDNDYFTWTDTSEITAYQSDGTKTNVYELRYTESTTPVTGTSETISTLENDGTEIEVTCTTYYVYTGNEFRYVLSNSGIKGSQSNPIRVVLMNDIDLDGKCRNWSPINGKNKSIYIEGNGHTIYNLYSGSSNSSLVGLYSYAPYYFAVKNLAFKSTMLLQTNNYGTNSSSGRDNAGDQVGLLAAYGGPDCYLYNVHSTVAYIQTDGGNGAGGLIGRNQQSNGRYGGDMFIENCSTSNCIIYGSNHIGGLTSYYGIKGKVSSSSFKYSDDMPDDPMYYVFGESDSSSYPIMIKNTYSVDCTLFSTGADSGAFISCGDSIWAKNCFTNNTIYAADNTGGFIGRCDNHDSTFPMKDDANQTTVGCYFENCYSTGVVEGKSCMGGFVGVDMGCHDYHTHMQYSSSSSYLQTATKCTVYKNCYTTAMVGMDYTGKYCGGFIGFDDNNYASSYITTGYESTGSSYTEGAGSWYINCYSAGEVGNILTVTDKEEAAEQEYTFFTGYKNNPNSDDYSGMYGDILNSDESLDYYPTGGFAGAMCMAYKKSGTIKDVYVSFSYTTDEDSSTGSYNGQKTDCNTASGGYGNFFNCYYDVQTTAMHEMAVGLKAYAVSNGGVTLNDSGKVTATTTSSDYVYGKSSTYFSLSGVTPVYTEKSTEKGMMGLTDFASSADASTYTGSMNGSDTSWTYADQYYPQLSVFMASDMNKSSLSEITADDITEAIKGSEFYIEDSTDDGDATDNDLLDASYSKPVLSVANSTTTTTDDSGNSATTTTFNSNTYAAQMQQVVTAYRYSQASTSTVLLNHWDEGMTTSGTVGDEKGWVDGLDDNAFTLLGTGENIILTDSTDSGKTMTVTDGVMTIGVHDGCQVYKKTYTGLAAGSYEFKIQQGTSKTYNYGADGYNGNNNFTLTVGGNDAEADIYFAYDPATFRTDDFYVYSVVTYTNENGQEVTITTELHEPDIYVPNTYYLAGSFNQSTLGSYPSWDTTSDKAIQLDYVGIQQGLYDSTITSHIYSKTLKLSYLSSDGETLVSSYNFKVSTYNWGSDWGNDSGSDIKLVLNQDAEVTFYFSEDEGYCKVVATPAGAIDSCDAHDTTEKWSGTSVVTSSTNIFGYKWLGSDATDAYNACQNGNMTYDEATGTYSVSASIALTDDDKETLLKTGTLGLNYAYKIVFDGVDNTDKNRQFNIKYEGTETNASNLPETLNVTFHYNPNGDDSSSTDSELSRYVTVETNDFTVVQSAAFDSYGISGDESLTGYSWIDKNNDDYNDWMTLDNTDELWKKTYYNVSEGTYSFKVIAGGDWNTGIDWGNPNNSKDGNYTFTLTSNVNDVTITFDPESTDEVQIKVTASDETAIERSQYVTTATRTLTRYIVDSNGNYLHASDDTSWNKTDPVMNYNTTTGRYEQWFIDVPANEILEGSVTEYKKEPNLSYAFKVIEYGKDTGNNIVFMLADDPETAEKDTYNICVYYYEGKKLSQAGMSVYKFTDTNRENDLNSKGIGAEGSLVQSFTPSFYSVLGDEAFTGYNWGASSGTASERLAALQGGLMTEKETGVWEKTYTVDDLPLASSDSGGLSVLFKIAANGSWDSGLDWGAESGVVFKTESLTEDGEYTMNAEENGSNIELTLARPNENYPTSCRVTITYDTNIKKITITAFADGSEYNESYLVESNPGTKTDWYITCEASLFSGNFAEATESTVYDTVRDITSTFDFTYGLNSEEKGVLVDFDDEKISGDNFSSVNKFSLSYTLTDTEENYTYDITGNFDVDVVALDVEAIEDTSSSGSEDLLTRFYVDDFSPGKTWLTVKSVGYGNSGKYEQWKTDYLQYMQYVEDKEIYDDLEALYVSICSSRFTLDGLPITEKNIIEFLEQISTGTDDEQAVYAQLVDHAETVGYSNGDLLAVKKTMEDDYISKPTLETINSTDQSIVGSRSLRLIPTNYLEAGLDATVSVIDTDIEQSNAVSYDTASKDGGSFVTTVLDGDNTIIATDRSAASVSTSYYNYAATAAYLTTDKIGLGIYYNYTTHRIINYDEEYLRDDSVSAGLRNAYTDGTSGYDGDTGGKSSENYRYYAMSSVYTQSASYSDTVEDKGLYPETKVNQSLIGNTDDTEVKDVITDGVTTQEVVATCTKVDVFKLDKEGDGKTLVNMDSSKGDGDVRKDNYEKWSGNKLFTADDAQTADQSGKYEVVYYWALADGRYLTDSKTVTIKVVEPGIEKSVDVAVDTAAENNELTYTVTYTNASTALMLDYAILDVLPFDEDVRTNSEGETIRSTVNGTNDSAKFKIKSIELDAGSSLVNGVYVTNSAAVQDYLYQYDDDNNKLYDDDGVPVPNVAAAGNIDTEGGKMTDDAINDGGWKAVDPGDNSSSVSVYSSGTLNVNEDATAFAVTGLQLVKGQSIQVKVTLEYDGVVGDTFYNNAFYYVKVSAGYNSSSIAGESFGYSNPTSTRIIRRDISGFAWLDSDSDGIIDSNEPKIQGLVAELFTYDKDYGYVSTGETCVTDSNGYYEFTGVLDYSYVVRFTGGSTVDETDDAVTAVLDDETKTLEYDSLTATRRQGERSEKLDSSTVANGVSTHNLAKSVTTTDNSSGVESTYYETYSYTMPGDSQVASMTETSVLKTRKNCTFDSSNLFIHHYQNVGFRLASDTNDPTVVPYYSVDVTKYGRDTDPTTDDVLLQGVTFKLQYYNTTDETWYDVYQVAEDPDSLTSKTIGVPECNLNDGQSGELYVLETGEEGDCGFYNLTVSGKYRLVELNTVDDYTILIEPVEFELPYSVTVTQEQADGDYTVTVDSNYSITNASKESADNSTENPDGTVTLTYNSIGVTVINTNQQFDLPLTGTTTEIPWYLILASALLAVAVVMFIISQKRKRTNRLPSRAR